MEGREVGGVRLCLLKRSIERNLELSFQSRNLLRGVQVETSKIIVGCVKDTNQQVQTRGRFDIRTDPSSNSEQRSVVTYP